MTITSDERRAINRENARHSTGPRSEEGKARSRNNALKHGLCAELPAALPDEDPAAVKARADEWDSYYRPQSPAARHLVDQCVRATLMADRLDRYHSAELTNQVRTALAEWDQSGADGGRPSESDRAEAAGRALVLHDPASARLFLRYHAESRTAFHRAYQALVQTLDRDRLGDDDPSVAFSPNEPTEATHGSRNEARSVAPDSHAASPNEPNPVPPPADSRNEPTAAAPRAPGLHPRWDDEFQRKYNLIIKMHMDPSQTPEAVAAALDALEAELWGDILAGELESEDGPTLGAVDADDEAEDVRDAG